GHFGEGLVHTPDNWGFLGQLPTHPELLDWLASHFVEAGVGTNAPATSPNTQHPTPNAYACGWSFKKLHKLILMSNTYKMSSQADAVTVAKADKADPANLLLWKMPRHRLEAEPFRDAMLFVSGKIDPTMGGSLL